MPNDNYVAATSLFANAGPFGFRSPNAADFSAVDPENGCFAAQVVFVPRGGLQDAGGVVAQYLWGNRDPVGAPNAGWSIRLAANAGQLAVVGSIGRGAGVVEVQANLSGAGSVAWVERLLCVGLWLSWEPAAYLTINGMVVASGALATAFAPSDLPVALGIQPVTPSAEAADGCDIVSAAYTYNTDYDNLGEIGSRAGTAFDAERSCFGGNAFDPSFGVDWVHRYSARSLAAGLAATIVKRPQGAAILANTLPQPFGYPAAPASWPDLGNLLVPSTGGSVINNPPYNPVNLVRIGPLFQGNPAQPVVLGRKNVTWYEGGAFTFT